GRRQPEHIGRLFRRGHTSTTKTRSPSTSSHCTSPYTNHLNFCTRFRIVFNCILFPSPASLLSQTPNYRIPAGSTTLFIVTSPGPPFLGPRPASINERLLSAFGSLISIVFIC